MVLKRQIKLKRVKDLEPGDIIQAYGLILKVGGVRDGKFYFYGEHSFNENWKRLNELKISAKSQQWVELIENSKRIEG